MASDSQEIIVEDYSQSLNDLTFNSRPIIDNLTTIAKENTNVADGIINAITNRIYKCIPDQKLFTLYLLDSICKTIGNPYNILVGDDIFKLFSHVYLLVNDNVRQQMIKLFETWKLTKTKGTNLPLFPKEQLDKIESFLVQAGYTKKKELTNHSLIEGINTLIPIFQSKLMNNPDPKLKDRFNALNQLKALLSSQPMKAAELQAVQAQLNTIKQQEINAPIPTPATTPAPTPGIPSTQLMPAPPPISNKADDLLQMLIAFGLVKVDQSLKPGSKPTYELVYPKIKYQVPSNELPSSNVLYDILTSSNLSSSGIQRNEYEQVKFRELSKIQIESSKNLQAFINSNNPSIQSISLLYDAKPSKCGICGKRFTNDENGTNKKRLHLDWHFRINKKLSGNVSSVQARNWYLDDYDWVKFKDEDLLEYSTTSHTKEETSVNLPTTSQVPYVIVPSSETNMNNKCLICREQVKATYNDDLGEWCWLNCIKVQGEGKNGRKIVHANCSKETKKRGPEDDLHPKTKREKA